MGYDEGSWTAWIVGVLADGIPPLVLLVFAVLCIVRGGRARQGGLRFVGAGLAAWAVTDLLAWPLQSRFVYDTVYGALGTWFGSNYAALSDLVGTFIGAVCVALGLYGALQVVDDVAAERTP